MPVTKEQEERFKEKLASGEIDPNDPMSKAFIRTKYDEDPLGFSHKFLKEHVSHSVTGEDIASAPFHFEIMDLYLTNDNIAIAAPRGHAKSTVTTLIYAIHCLLYGKKKNVVIVSESEDMAKKFAKTIRDELEFNPAIVTFFGPQRTDKWSETEFQIANGAVVHAKGRGAQLRGLKVGASRPDLIVCDDLEDEEMVRSETRRNDLEEWFNKTVLPTVDPNTGQIVFIGTILHMDSLLNRCINPELYPDFISRRYKSYDDDGNLLWPSYRTMEYFQERKKAYIARGRLAAYYMEYLNDPVPEEDATFKGDYFQFYNEIPDEVYTEVYIDLGGGSERKTADPTAMVVLSRDKHNTLYVNDYVNARMGTDVKRILNEMFALYEKYAPRKFVIEKTTATNMIKASLEEEMKKRNVHLNIEYVSPTRGSGGPRGNMSDGKYQRIAAMEGAFKLGVIKMRPWMSDLQEQLLRFPRAKHDDLVDALAYGYMYIGRKRQSTKTRVKPKEDFLLPFEKPKTNLEYEPLYPELGI